MVNIDKKNISNPDETEQMSCSSKTLVIHDEPRGEKYMINIPNMIFRGFSDASVFSVVKNGAADFKSNIEAMQMIPTYYSSTLLCVSPLYWLL